MALSTCQILSAAPTPDDFMGSLAENVKLRNLSLLGSHDAGTYGLDASLGISPDETGTIIETIGEIPILGNLFEHTVIHAWSEAQKSDLSSQLNQGVRYFDLRIAIDANSEFRICHGLYGPLIDDLLNQINTFLTQHPKEIVFLDFHTLFDQNGQTMNIDQQNQLFEKILQHLGPKIAPSSFGADVTLGQMWGAEAQVILFWAASPTNSFLWNRSTFLSSVWYNVTSWDDLQPALDQGLTMKSSGQFYVSQAILTPDATMILTHLFCNLLDVGETVNEQIIEWVRQKIMLGLAGNILMVDCVDSISSQAFQIFLDYNSQIQSEITSL